MQLNLSKIYSVVFCSALFFFADLSGSSRVVIIKVSGCWSGKTLKSLSEERAVAAGAIFALPMQSSSVEISFLGCARRDSRQNPQVSALFTEEGKYAR
jgi:hypothetical protein